MDTIENVFINPPAFGKNMVFRGNPLWTVGQLQEITLRTNDTNYSIALFQQSITVPQAYNRQTVWTSPVNGGSGETSFNWTVDNYNNDLNFSPVFYLGMVANSGDQWPSHYFNITMPPTTTVASTGATVTVSQGATGASSATSASNTTSAPTSNDSSNSSASTIGIAVGVSLGVVILIMAIAGFFLLRRYRQRSQSPSIHAVVPETAKYDSYRYPQYASGTSNYGAEVDGNGRPAELDRNHSPVEIGGGFPR